MFDFSTINNLNDWQEISDTVRRVGMSKATLVLQKTQVFQRAVFFALLNPQPNGAGFAGVRTHVKLDLSGSTSLAITCRGQGQNFHYKVVLRHQNQEDNDDIEYEHLFDAPLSTDEFSTIKLDLANFKPFFRGREMPDAPPLDTSKITMIGIQIYGGVYSSFKQAGVSALEIEKIEATSTV